MVALAEEHEMPPGYTNDLTHKERLLCSDPHFLTNLRVYQTLYGSGKIESSNGLRALDQAVVTINFDGGATKRLLFAHNSIFIEPIPDEVTSVDSERLAAALRAAVIKPGYMIYSESRSEFGIGTVTEIINKGDERLLLQIAYIHPASHTPLKLLIDPKKETLIIIGEEIDGALLSQVTPKDCYFFTKCDKDTRNQINESITQALKLYGKPRILTADEISNLKEIATFTEISESERQASSSKPVIGDDEEDIEVAFDSKMKSVPHVPKKEEINGNPGYRTRSSRNKPKNEAELKSLLGSLSPGMTVNLDTFLKLKSLKEIEVQTIYALLDLKGNVNRSALSEKMGISPAQLDTRLVSIFPKFKDVVGGIREGKLEMLREYFIEISNNGYMITKEMLASASSKRTFERASLSCAPLGDLFLERDLTENQAETLDALLALEDPSDRSALLALLDINYRALAERLRATFSKFDDVLEDCKSDKLQVLLKYLKKVQGNL